MSADAQKTAVGERLPYLLAKLKAPRVLERLEQTAARAREEQWPYEQFLEALLEAEVFARDASGARGVFTHGLVCRPTSTAFLASRPAATITEGFDVLVHDVIAAITTWPWSIVNVAPSSSDTATSW